MADTNDLDNIIQQLLGGVTLVSPTGTGAVGTTAYTPFSQGSTPTLTDFQSILSKPPTTTSTWNPTIFAPSSPASSSESSSPPATTLDINTQATIDTTEYTPFQTPPPIAPDVNVTTGESASEWIQRWLPNSAAFWQNFAQADVAQSDQLMQQAMEAYNARMNELAGLLNQGVSDIGTTREDYLGSLGDATSVYSIGLDQALNALTGEDASFWQNLAKTSVTDADQLMRQAMDVFGTRMNELSGALNQGLSDIGTARESYLGSLGNAVNTYSGGLDQALNVLQDLASKSDLSNYMQNIQTGTIPQTTADMMDQIKQNMIDEAQYQLQYATQQNVNDVLETLGAKNMLDSSRMGQAMRGIAYDQGNLMNSVMRDIENQWMARRLQEPYNQLQAAVTSLAGYEPLMDIATTQLTGAANLSDLLAAQGLGEWQSQRENLADAMLYGLQQAALPQQYYEMAYRTPENIIAQQNAMMNQLQNLANTKLSGAANISDMLAAQGLAGWQSQRQNLADIMQYGLQQAEMPKTFYQMAYTKPTSAVEQQNTMMNQLLNIWDTLLNAELQREAISAERDIADLQYDDSFDFWDILF